MKKSWTDIFIQRPVLAICVNLLILLLGLTSIQKLNVRQYPRSDSSAVVVTTAYVGANADLVRGFITTPLERAIASAEGLDYLESSSKQGISTITARLRLNFDVNAALTQIQAKVNQVRNELPPEAEAPVINITSADTQLASMYLSFYSDTLDPNQITDYLIRVIQPRLSAIKGVQKADILGARTFAMRIWLKPDRMSALGISPAEVRTALAQNNALSAVGSTKGNMVQVNLVANTNLKSREEFEQLVIRQDKGTLTRLRDIAEVVLGAETYDDDVRFAGEQATFMGIYVLPNANSIDVIKRVRNAFPELQSQLPAGMKSAICYDSTTYIDDSIHEVIKTLSETVLIVIIVIYLFIGSLRGVLVPVIAIPLSLVGACLLMMLFGFTINLLTLLAIVLAVGIVVDDAIVMLENVERHIHEGLAPIDAAIKAARELVGPTIAMTITLATVYAPIGFQGGLTGTLFREFALTLAGAVVISGIVALTLSPMMASRLLKSRQEERPFQRRLNAFFDRLKEGYRRVLGGALSAVPVMIVLAFLITLLIVPFAMFSGKELAPMEDQGFTFSIIFADPQSTLDQTKLYTAEIEKIYRSFAEYALTFQVINPTGGFGGMVLKPWSERKRTVMEILPEASEKFSHVPGVKIIPLAPAPLPGGSDFGVEFILVSTNEPRQLFELSNILVEKANTSGLFMYADSDLKYDLPQAEIVIDRDKASAMGLNMSQIANDLGSMLGGNYVNRFSIQGRSYKVIPQAQRSSRLTADQLSEIYITGPGGTLIQLSSIATIKETVEPRQLNRFQQLNSVKIQGALIPNVTPDQALTFLEQETRKIAPPGFSYDYSGGSRQLRTEGDAFWGTMMLALILIYLVLAAQFESFRDPLIVLAGSVPLALASAFLVLFLGLKGATVNIYTQVGMITLIGLIAKNGILIVEFANKLMEEQGLTKREAALEAACTRLRPILMTTVATVIGHLPLVFVTGAGAAARNHIGIVLVAGMAVGTLFTLFILPAFYVAIADGKRGQHKREKPRTEALPSSTRNGNGNGGHQAEPALLT